MLKQHRAEQLEQRMKKGPTWAEQDLVFCSREGKPSQQRNVRRTIKRLLKEAELPVSTRVHDLRHGVASMLLERGVLGNVSLVLGHSARRSGYDL